MLLRGRPVRRAWQEQKQFVSDASHELKTPLTVILSSTELAGGERDPEKTKQYVEGIRVESLRMKALVEDMLTLARTESGAKQTLDAVNLSDTVLESALAFEPVAFESGRELSYNIQPELTVRGSAVQLRRLAEESRCTYLQDYIRAMIDAANLRSLVRTARLHSDPGFLRQVLFDGGSITVDTILSHIGGGIAPLYHATPFREAAEAGEETLHGSSLTVFERACDNAVLAAAGKARSVPFGVEVVLGYLAAKESEWVAVRIIMSGRMAGMTADAIRERLRDQYV